MGMTKSVAVSLFAFVLFVPSAFWQNKVPEPSGVKPVVGTSSTGQTLEIVTIGEIMLSSGHHGAFRIYQAPDGDKGQVDYSQFSSAQEAEQQLAEWLKLAQKVTSRESNKGGKISDRIVAQRELKKSGKKEKEFLIIRRDGVNCYLIQALSLRMAMDVEGMIEHRSE
jgi:hypothetical protein